MKNSISLSFIISGNQKEKELNMSAKLCKLLEKESKTQKINTYLQKIKKVEKINFLPYLKISKDNEPLTYAFRISINHKLA